jgi:beta-lactamase class A
MINPAKIVSESVAGTVGNFSAAKLGAEEIAVTLVVLGDESATASHRGDAPIYPASVVKLFYLVAAHQWLETGRIADSTELRRGLRDMIVDSGNEATAYVLDVLTSTTSGPELAAAELAVWHEQRNAVNRFFHARGYPEINANRKTWHEGPYGRDKQAVDHFTPARNSLTTNATARLLVEIAKGTCVSTARSAQMLELLCRDFSDPKRTDLQGCEFIGAALPPTARLWSKAGYMSVARHDAAIIELAAGRKFVLVIFTEKHSDEKGIIPDLAARIFAGLKV